MDQCSNIHRDLDRGDLRRGILSMEKKMKIIKGVKLLSVLVSRKVLLVKQIKR